MDEMAVRFFEEVYVMLAEGLPASAIAKKITAAVRDRQSLLNCVECLRFNLRALEQAAEPCDPFLVDQLTVGMVTGGIRVSFNDSEAPGESEAPSEEERAGRYAELPPADDRYGIYAETEREAARMAATLREVLGMLETVRTTGPSS